MPSKKEVWHIASCKYVLGCIKSRILYIYFNQLNQENACLLILVKVIWCKENQKVDIWIVRNEQLNRCLFLYNLFFGYYNLAMQTQITGSSCCSSWCLNQTAKTKKYWIHMIKNKSHGSQLAMFIVLYNSNSIVLGWTPLLRHRSVHFHTLREISIFAE